MKKSKAKVVASVMTVALLMGGAGASVYAVNYSEGSLIAETKKDDASEVDVEKILSEDLPGATGDGLNKEETVYVIAGSQGEVDKIIVSDWIQNGKEETEIKDQTELKDIKNTKGNESFKMDSENSCVWDAKGHDIYYQGTTDKKLPVDVKVSYMMDGRTVTPEEIAGKSGKVTIRFDYTNNEYQMKQIDGKEEKIYVPFAMLTGMIFDNETFSNIEVTNGKIINEGDKTIVTGLSFPGLKDDLGLSGDIDIPDYVEITADTKAFEMKNTVTVATSSILDDVDTAKLDENNIKDNLDKLQDGMNKLIDGSSELYDGIATLLDKSEELVEGIRKLADGAKQLADGAKSTDAGAEKLKNGAGNLSAGAQQLAAGTQQLAAGTQTLADSKEELAAGVYSLRNGLNDLANYPLEEQISKGFDQYASSLSGKSAEASAAAAQYAAAKEAAADALAEMVEDDGKTKQDMLAAAQSLAEAAAGQAQYAATAGTLESAVGGIGQVEAGVTGGIGKYKSNVAEAAAGAEQMYEKLPELSEGIEALNTGAQAVNNGAAGLEQGSNALYAGTDTLKEGTKKLADGAEQLYKGIMELDDNMPALIEGVTKLKDGAMELSDGLKKFNDEGISKIVELADGDLGKISSRLSAVVEVAKDYKSFSGLGEGMDGSTKFIYKTEEVKDPSKSN